MREISARVESSPAKYWLSPSFSLYTSWTFTSLALLCAISSGSCLIFIRGVKAMLKTRALEESSEPALDWEESAKVDESSGFGSWYVQAPLAYPRERKRRMNGGEDWLPFCVYSDGQLANPLSPCYWSDYYSVNPRLPHITQLAPWVAKYYLHRKIS